MMALMPETWLKNAMRNASRIGLKYLRWKSATSPPPTAALRDSAISPSVFSISG